MLIISRQKGIFIEFIKMNIQFVMAFLLWSGKLNRLILLNYQAAIYVIILGLIKCINIIAIDFNPEIHISFSLPVFMAALIPNFIVKNIKKDVHKGKIYTKEKIESTEGPYVSIYVYAKDEGYNRMGHLDFAYNGIIYSYGAHDPYNRMKSMALGDGVLIVGKEEDYPQFSINSGAVVIRFLCYLDEVQNESIGREIEKMMERTTEFNFPIEKDRKKEHHLTHLMEYSKDFNFYKFNEEPFKTYNVFTTNCVLLVDEIFRETGMRLFNLSGIITPGAYYDYLNELFQKEDDMVMKKDVYYINQDEFKVR